MKKTKSILTPCTVVLNAETLNQFKAVAKKHKFPLSRFLNDCMKEYLNVSSDKGFSKDVTLQVGIRTFQAQEK